MPYWMGFSETEDYWDVTQWLSKYKRYIGKCGWFNRHEHNNAYYSIYSPDITKTVCQGVTTEACADAWPGEAKGVARLVEVYSDNHVEMSLIEGLWP
jgi:hypothetical protein